MSEERQDADSDSDRDSGNDEPNENVAENGGATAERVKREPSPSSTEHKLEDKSHSCTMYKDITCILPNVFNQVLQ